MMHRRRRQFSLPFVLVMGCGAAKPAPQQPANLPEAPGRGTVTRETAADGVVVLSYESGDKVYVHKNGTCFAEYSAACGPSQNEMEPMSCNPPPPQQVTCPATK
ncbi:MAG: hypothetical protein SFX73_11810 [Kofleriaceae bacterium]|nr:hypothetical protein [Kofleriaceae bacterium]